ncbi:MAG: hypothetical protein ACKN9T_18880 [Candidatus Methylumidiphilus sp.]
MNSDDYRPLGEAICAQIIAEIRKLGFAENRMPTFPDYAQVSFTTTKDPYSGQDSLIGTWRDSQGQRVGELKFHGDGSFYAEYDVVRPHPTNHRWFVEAVVAWGRDDLVKTEAKLLPAIG